MLNRYTRWFHISRKSDDTAKLQGLGVCLDCGQKECLDKPSCPNVETYRCLHWHSPGTIAIWDDERPE